MGPVILVLWLVLSILVGVVATKRGRSGALYCVMAVFFSPVIVYAMLIGFPIVTDEVDVQKVIEGTHRRCPQCDEVVRIKALVCRCCQSRLPSVGKNVA